MSEKKPVFHIISNTHWDREWRFPFQRNRQMLVDMIDSVLKILENEPEYRAFHLDSQSIVLKDYLEIKPQNRDRIVKLTRENRLLHGPWYILPEEFQVGGENLIRNLLFGHKISRDLGGTSKIGYSPFSWGQISQLPQIYKEFGIEMIMFYRGVNSIDSPKAEFLWEGADGTTMVSSRFSTMPRYNFYFYIYRPVIHNEWFFDLEYPWGSKGTPFHFADALQSEEDYFIISPHKEYFPEFIEPQVNKIIADQAEDFTTRHKIWMEGHDSSGPNAQTVRIIRDLREKMPHINVVHSTLEEYARSLLSEVESETLKLVKGERRSTQNNNRCGNLFGYTTSARMYLKQANFDAERWIQYYAEPFNVFSAWAGRDIQDQYPEIAWEMIVQNSAHDSIGGCSLDRIHEDMIMRYKHSIEISKGIFERSLKYLISKLNTSIFGADVNAIFITAANATNYSQEKVLKAWVDIPAKFDKGSVRVLDESGNELIVQLLSRKPHQPVLEQMINRPLFFDMIRYQIFLQTNEIPSFGLRTMHVVPAQGKVIKVDSTIDRFLENDFLKVYINPDGSLDVFDKENKTEYKKQAFLLDKGEAGHAWVHLPVDPIISTLDTIAKIRKTIQGPLYNEYEICHYLKLPADLAARQGEPKDYLINEVLVLIGLAKGSRHLDIRVIVDNQSESHRLRLMFPSGINTLHSHGEGQFDAPARPLELPDSSDWIEKPMPDFPLHHFVDVSDGQKGLAILVDGLKEYEVLNDEEKTIAITLFRTFEYKINPAAPQDYSYEKGSQMLGKNEFRLAFYPHRGDWIKGQVYREAFLFNYDVRLVQTGHLNGCLGTSTSFLKIEPEELIFSCLKKSEKSCEEFVLRIFNPSNKTLQGRIITGKAILKADEVTLEELHKESIPLEDTNSFRILVPPLKIKTIKLIFLKQL